MTRPNTSIRKRRRTKTRDKRIEKGSSNDHSRTTSFRNCIHSLLVGTFLPLNTKWRVKCSSGRIKQSKREKMKDSKRYLEPIFFSSSISIPVQSSVLIVEKSDDRVSWYHILSFSSSSLLSVLNTSSFDHFLTINKIFDDKELSHQHLLESDSEGSLE